MTFSACQWLAIKLKSSNTWSLELVSKSYLLCLEDVLFCEGEKFFIKYKDSSIVTLIFKSFNLLNSWSSKEYCEIRLMWLLSWIFEENWNRNNELFALFESSLTTCWNQFNLRKMDYRKEVQFLSVTMMRGYCNLALTNQFDLFIF